MINIYPVIRCAIYLFLMAATVFLRNEVAAQEYQFVTAIRSPVVKSLVLPARMSDRQVTSVQAPRDGKIKEVYGFIGDQVNRGSVLAQMDNQELQVKRAALMAQRNELTGNLRRVEGLMSRGLVSDEIWSNNLQKVTQLRAELAVIEEKIKAGQIISNAAGTILWTDLHTGQTVQGAEILLSIGDGKNIWLETTLPQQDLAYLSVGDAVALILDDTSTPVRAAVDSISVRGPQHQPAKIYIKAPRMGQIDTEKSYDVLIPLSAQGTQIILPEDVLDAEGYIYQLMAAPSEPDFYAVIKSKPVIRAQENGILTLEGLTEATPVLMNPAQEIHHRQIIKAAPYKGQWADTYAVAVLQNQALAARSSCAGGDSAPGAAGGGCGGCGGSPAAGQQPSHPEERVCLVAADVFALPEVETAPGAPVLVPVPLPLSVPEQ